MSNLRRAAATRLLVIFGVLALAATCWAQQRPPVLEKIAKTYGLDSWGQVEAVRYTFALTAGPLNLSRTWTWEPKTGKVTFDGKDKDGKPVHVTYSRSDMNSQPDNVKKEVDPGFINDNYWFIFPFHALWDTSATATDEGMQKLPQGKGRAQKVVVKYGSELGGYTPGDTWELYLSADGRVQEMAFHHGGDAKPQLVLATWAGYKKAGPLLVSTEHRGTADGKPLHLTFMNVAVKMAGSDKWEDAK